MEDEVIRALLRILAITGIVYVCICVLIYFFQDRLIYLPNSSMTSTPESMHLSFEEVWLTSSGGKKIHAWFVPCKNGRGTAVFCHGNAGNMENRLGMLPFFQKFRLSVLLFDYQGYGKSEGSPSEANTCQDAEAAWRYLTETRTIPPDRIVVWGRSLGTGVAVDLASRHAPGGLVVEAAFTSIPDVAADIYPFWLPVRLLCRTRFDSASKVPAIACPKLFIHSPDDEIIPITLGRRLFDLAPKPRRFVTIRGDHNNGFIQSGRDYTDPVDAFLDEVL